MKTRVVVLAAGRSKRMKSDIPKVLIPFNGKCLIEHLLKAIIESGVDSRPVIVINEETGSLIKEKIGDQYDYVTLDEPLGTGYAVQATESFLRDKADQIIVFYGDHPFITPETIKGLDELHHASGEPLAMLTTVVEDFEDWRFLFKDFGRIKRDPLGNVVAIIEMKDASPEEQMLKEVNPAFFSFQASWLWEHLKKLKNENSQKEYYLTDLVQMAIEEGHPVRTTNASPLESVGINTPEQLEIVRAIQ